jgi:Mg2+ and Co2+ transporter CorA
VYIEQIEKQRDQLKKQNESLERRSRNLAEQNTTNSNITKALTLISATFLPANIYGSLFSLTHQTSSSGVPWWGFLVAVLVTGFLVIVLGLLWSRKGWWPFKKHKEEEASDGDKA